MSEQGKPLRFSMRQLRVLDALAITTGYMPREVIRRILGASSGPSDIDRLRAKLGRESIEAKTEKDSKSDGRVVRPERYRLKDEGRSRLAQAGVTHCG